MKNKMEIGCFVIFMIPFYVVGFVLLGYSLWSAWHSTRAGSWPTTPGTINHVTVQEKPNDDHETYDVKVHYTYTVDGATYEGTRIAFGYDCTTDPKHPGRTYEKLKDAKKVVVRYNPKDPSVCCLSFGLHRYIKIGLIFSITWLTFTIGISLCVWLGMRADDVLVENLSIQ